MDFGGTYCQANSYWRVVAASARGAAHIAQQKPCQDAFAVLTSDNGWLTAVVADGAGSAEHSETGAAVVVEVLSNHLTSQFNLGPAQHDPCVGHDPRCVVEAGIQKARQRLAQRQFEQIASRDTQDPELAEIISQPKDGHFADRVQDQLLRKYHATVVGTVVGPDGGFFFHIGDGAAVATQSEKLHAYVFSEPKNGETAEETFFFTERDWKDNLHFVEFGREYDLLVLMSDGAMVFAVAPQLKGLHPPFIIPVNKFMKESWSEGAGAALQGTLDSEQARNLTPDDKTLVWILRQPGA